MPRKLRVEYPGAMYHVMSRGNRRQDIYLDDVERQDFLKTLAEACQKTDWQAHAYCLMGNHYQLATRRKSDPAKLNIAARLRRETTLSIKTIAARLGLGTSKSANTRLHAHMRQNQPIGLPQLELGT